MLQIGGLPSTYTMGTSDEELHDQENAWPVKQYKTAQVEPIFKEAH